MSVAAELALAGPDGHLAAGLAADRASAETNQPSDPQARFLLFASTDAWRNGGFNYGGVQWAPAGVDRQGFPLKLMFGGGVYGYVSGALGNAEVIGRQLSVAILPGWRFVRDKLIVTIFAGPEFQNHELSPVDPSAGLRGPYFGARAGFDAWNEPNEITMIAADGSISSVGLSYSARLAAGLRVLGLFYVGPEVQAFAAGTNYQQYRAGIHLTGLHTGAFEWSAGLGWAADSDSRSSLYGKLGLLTKR
jgi:hypothetical protein